MCYNLGDAKRSEECQRTLAFYMQPAEACTHNFWLCLKPPSWRPLKRNQACVHKESGLYQIIRGYVWVVLEVSKCSMAMGTGDPFNDSHKNTQSYGLAV